MPYALKSAGENMVAFLLTNLSAKALRNAVASVTVTGLFKRTCEVRGVPIGRHLLKLATTATTTLGIVIMTMTAHTNSDSSLAASPTSGTAPLVVTFTGTGSGIIEGVMQLDFGDGQTDSSISPIRDFTRTAYLCCRRIV